MNWLILLCLSFAAVVSGQDDRVRCWTGTRVQVQGFTAFDNSFQSYCAEGENVCNTYTYVQQVVNEGIAYELVGEYGECSSQPQFTCDSILPFLEPIGPVSNCSVAGCSTGPGPACNYFTFPAADTNCSVPSDDVRAFPGCSMRESIKAVFECVTPLTYNFPYDDHDVCHDTINKVITCMGEKTAHCLDSNCPTIFDSISGFRSRFSEYSFWAANIKTSKELADVVSNYTGGSFDLMDVIKNYICHPNQTNVFQVIDQMEADRVNIDGLVQSLFPTFNCPKAFSRLQNSGYDFLRHFYNSSNQAEVWNAFKNSISDLQGLFEGCNYEVIAEDAAGVFESLNFTLPQGQLQHVFEIGAEFADYLPKPDLPNPESCPSEESFGGKYGMIRLGCERLFNVSSRCSRRKAWACNFAEWRFNFLRTWLDRFYEQYSDEDLPVPECGNDADFVKCKDSELCCYDAPNGCRLCYCTGHDYANSYGDILASWRHSYNEWNQFFRAFNEFSRNSDTCF